MAALLVGSAGGFLVGKSSSPSDEEKGNTASSVVDLRRDGKRSNSSSDSEARRPRTDSVKGALSEPSQLGRLQSLMDLYASMDAAQLEEAAKNLDTLPMGDRMMASMLLFSQWGEVDPHGALEYTKTMGFDGMFARPTLMRSWASMDPVNAAKYFTENPDDFATMGGRGGPGRGDSGAGVIALEWAKLDPQAALDWAQGLDGRNKSTALVSVIGEMAAKDPAEAASVASGLEDDDRNRAYSEIAEKWAMTDYDSAEAWINTLSGEDKQDAMGSAISVLANSDPQGASLKVVSMTEGREKERAIRDVGSSWARENPAAAAEWVAAQESGGDGMRSVIATWSGQDAPAALSFIESQPQGEIRDSATQAYLWTNRDMAPSQSITLAETITDDRDRSRAIGMTASRWMREDEAAAKAYVEQSTAIDDGMKERLLNGNDGGRGRGRGGPGGGR